MHKKLIRFFDIMISIFIVVIFFPLLLMISFLIYILDGTPIIYEQIRVGYNGKKFRIYKFRTMKNNLLKNKKLRLTKLGKIIRRLSLDEIPQFFNVLKGDMSIVGPRPLPEIYEKKINKKFKFKRRSVLPGITGMSQVNYAGKDRKLDEKVKLDFKFIDEYSVYNYFKILMKTPFVLIIRLLKNKSSIIN